MSDPNQPITPEKMEKNAERAADTGGPAVLSAQAARQGITTGRVRWILGVSLVLAIMAMAMAAMYVL
jgi:hypothetical protein